MTVALVLGGMLLAPEERAPLAQHLWHPALGLPLQGPISKVCWQQSILGATFQRSVPSHTVLTLDRKRKWREVLPALWSAAVPSITTTFCFLELQDTCVALQALAEYAILSYTGGVNLTISLASTNLDYQETFELNRGNKKLLQTTVVRGPSTCAGPPERSRR